MTTGVLICLLYKNEARGVPHVFALHHKLENQKRQIPNLEIFDSWGRFGERLL